jgi:hypothetical protein
MTPFRRSTRATHGCPHTNTAETANYGLVRRVCLHCGAVSLEHRQEIEEGVLFQIPELGER